MAAQLKTDVFAYEYPGYGASDPSSQPSEAGCYEAADAAFDYVKNVLKVDPTNVVLYGRSLGTGPTVEMALRQPQVSSLPSHASLIAADLVIICTNGQVAGVILQSPLTSGIRTNCCDCVAWFLCCIDVFKSVDKVAPSPPPSSPLPRVSSRDTTHDSI